MTSGTPEPPSILLAVVVGVDLRRRRCRASVDVLFVAVLGASSHTYAEAIASQQGPEWIRAHTNALLREATIAVALSGFSSREQRRWNRKPQEHPNRAWAHAADESSHLGLARPLLEQCVEHGQAWGAAGETIDTCLAWQAALTSVRKDVLDTLLIPEPVATSLVEGHRLASVC